MKRARKDTSGRFHHPWPAPKMRSFAEVLKWLVFSKNRFKELKKKKVHFEVVKPDFKALASLEDDFCVWLGHSTVLIRASGKFIITDPVFWDINIFIKRKTPFPVDPGEVPPVDFVLISHGHYDHLNTRTVKYLSRGSDPTFITGPGYERYLRRAGARNHKVIEWWEDYVSDGLTITALPVQHWSKRGIRDTNRMLWSSFLIRSKGAKYYWIGDTGYHEGFKEIGSAFGPIDYLFAPIGAYEPRWFMEPFHVNPEEALMIARDVQAKALIPIHWGTFDLTDEPLWLPIEHLKNIYNPENNPRLIHLPHGGSAPLTP